MKLNKRGAALFQVLIVSAILAGIATMVLRASLSRTISARKMRHTVATQLVMEACMAEVNNFWASKTPTQYAEDLAECRFWPEGTPDVEPRQYECTEAAKIGRTSADARAYAVLATMAGSNSNCTITYSIQNGTDL